MARKPLEVPPEVAKAFVRDMREFFKAKGQLKQDEIAARQVTALNAVRRPGDKKIGLTAVKRMFLAMKDQV
jgi:hypothetical protein